MVSVLGVDAGGTKTIAVVADSDGKVSGVGRSGPANFQDCGVAHATEAIRAAIEEATLQAGVDPAGLYAASYGVSGADRPQDFATVESFVRPLTPCPVFRLENDTIIALRAGTPDGVGIAVVAGTGSNTIGRTSAGRMLQVGGLGRLSGDAGSASQLAEAAVVAAIWGQDGRGPPTVLGDKITTHLAIERLEDIIEFFFHDADRSTLSLASLAPLVFEAASQGDPVAHKLLEQAGMRLADAVGVILDGLFPDDEQVAIVLGGSVLQRPANPTLLDALVRTSRKLRPGARFVKLTVEPVLGAVAFSFDDADWPLEAKTWKALKESYARITGTKVKEKP